MAEDKVSSLGTIAWYLSARDGYLSARVHPGMRLGEDAAGELSLKAEDAVIELDIEDGRLLVRAVSDSHELVVPGRGSLRDVSVSPQTQVQISFASNTLSVDTNFATDNPFSDSLEIQVVPIAVVDAEGNVRSALGPATAQAHAPAAPEAEPDPAGSDTDAQTDASTAADSDAPALDEEPMFVVREQEDPRGQDIVEETGLPADAASKAEDIGAEEAERAQQGIASPLERLLKEYATATADKRSERLATLSQLRSKLASRAAPLFVVAVLVGFFVFFQSQTQDPAAEPSAGAEAAGVALEESDSGAGEAGLEPDADSMPAGEPVPLASEAGDAAPVEQEGGESEASLETLGQESAGLLANVSTLLAGDQLPSKPTIDFALQSLKALRAAYPDDPGVRQSLETLTERLASEARLSFDRGEAFTAGRLIEQASSTGVAQDAVASTVAYFESAEGQRSASGDAAPVASLATAGSASADAEQARSVPPAEADEGVAAVPGDDVVPEGADLEGAGRAAGQEELDLEREAGSVVSAERQAPAATPTPSPEPESASGDETVSELASSAAVPVAPEADDAPGSVVEADINADLDALVALAEQEVLQTDAADGVPVETAEAEAPAAAAEDQAADSPDDAPASGGEALSVAQTQALGLEPERLDAELGPGTDGEVDPLAPGPDYTGETGEDLVAFTSVTADPELDAVLAEALGIVEQVPESTTSAMANGAPELYPFRELQPIRVDPPAYPRRALPGAEASVDIEMTVSETGRVRDVIVRGDPPRLFRRAATRAVSGWLFEPVMDNGEAVPVRTQVRLTFRG